MAQFEDQGTWGLQRRIHPTRVGKVPGRGFNNGKNFPGLVSSRSEEFASLRLCNVLYPGLLLRDLI